MSTFYYYNVASSGHTVGGVATHASAMWCMSALDLLWPNSSYIMVITSPSRIQATDSAGHVHVFVSGPEGAEVPYANLTWHSFFAEIDQITFRTVQRVGGLGPWLQFVGQWNVGQTGNIDLNPSNGTGRVSSAPAYLTFTDSVEMSSLYIGYYNLLKTVPHPAEGDAGPDYVFYQPAYPNEQQYDFYMTFFHSLQAPLGYYNIKFSNQWGMLNYTMSPMINVYTSTLTEFVNTGGGGLPEEMQIKNSAGQVVDFDFTNIENKLDQLIKDSTFVAKMDAMGVAPDYTPYLQDLVNAIVEKVMFEVQNGRLDETNRQLSLIDSRLHHDIPEAGIVDLIDVLQGGAGFDGKLKNPDGTPIDVKSLLEDVTTAIANGAILAGDKWEPLRGFFSMLRDRWS